jgi:shikimate dehydrogenase
VKQIVLAGYPLDHSMSPVMHNAAFTAMDLEQEFRYEVRPMLEEELLQLVESIRVGTVSGANITIPYKTKVMKHLSEVSEVGLAVGSVNTLYSDRMRVLGHNTDVKGFNESLKEHNISVRYSRATILGSGGAAKAVAFALAEAGIGRLNILNRTPSKAEKLAEMLRSSRTLEIHVGPTHESKNIIEDSDLLINCTPIGMYGHSINETPLETNVIPGELVVIDLVYNPLRTRLLKDAEKSGCKIVDGTSMLVHQGAAALEIWTGKRAPVEVMRRALLQTLEDRVV